MLARYPIDAALDFAAFGALDQIHPAIPDPFNLTPPDLGLPTTATAIAALGWWRETLGALRGFIAGPYQTLPRQVIHGDFGPGNALADGERIVSIHDFEFAMPGARAFDVASGLIFVMRIWERDAPAALTMARRFFRGYARHGGLTTAEIAALPQLMLLRDVIGAIWWAGRDLVAGDARKTIERIAEMQVSVAWLARYETAFRDALR